MTDIFTGSFSPKTAGECVQAFEDAWVAWADAGAPEDAMLELIGVSFVADRPQIFGKPNYEYVQREFDWYGSMSLSVDDFPGGAPAIWKKVASEDGLINSNYGFLLFSWQNGNITGGQYKAVIDALRKDVNTRQAIAIYTRPSIHDEWNLDGGHDFICTNTVQYLIRDDKLEVVVNMRSNDAVFGYRNDFAWQQMIQTRILADLADTYPDLQLGKIIWQVGSLHIYPRHFGLVELFHTTGAYDAAL